MLDCMYVEAMQNMQRMPDYAKIFRGKPLRFVLPLHVQPNVPHTTTNCQEYENSVINNTNNNRKWEKEKLGNNLISLEGSKAEAYLLSDMNIFCVPECLCDLGCETPRINNEQNLGELSVIHYQVFRPFCNVLLSCVVKEKNTNIFMQLVLMWMLQTRER